jgi:hypothetical protein
VDGEAFGSQTVTGEVRAGVVGGAGRQAGDEELYRCRPQVVAARAFWLVNDEAVLPENYAVPSVGQMCDLDRGHWKSLKIGLNLIWT